MSNRFFRLPFMFDGALLQQDLTRCLASEWPQHFNTRDYSGQWTSIALRSASGTETDIASVPGHASYHDTPLLDACSYFRSVVSAFCCEKETVRLLRLGTGSVIHEHSDPGAAYADGFFRVHIPITSNDDTRFLVGGHELTMQPGECWYANFSLPHSVRNDGVTDRVHLVIDGLRNTWSDEVFAEAGYDFDEETRAKRMDDDTTRRVIETLRARGTEIDLRLAMDLEQQLLDDPWNPPVDSPASGWRLRRRALRVGRYRRRSVHGPLFRHDARQASQRPRGTPLVDAAGLTSTRPQSRTRYHHRRSSFMFRDVDRRCCRSFLTVTRRQWSCPKYLSLTSCCGRTCRTGKRCLPRRSGYSADAGSEPRSGCL
jgi:hypothetical protein